MACPVNMSSLRDSEPMWGDASLLHTGHPSGIQEEEHHFSDSLSDFFTAQLLPYCSSRHVPSPHTADDGMGYNTLTAAR